MTDVDKADEGRTQLTDKPTAAFTASKVLSILALGWFGYMSYLVWSWFALGFLNAVLPVWNSLFALGVAAIAVQLFRHREWARRWMQGAVLCTGIMNLLNAMKPGLEVYWIGVAVLGLCGLTLHLAREDYGSRDEGAAPGQIARALGMAALIGTVVIAIMPTSMFVP
ncbi:MAG: hypothetical protein ACKV2T_08365 [Kofleriaceae bacterium]